jgi:hypothetical protein
VLAVSIFCFVAALILSIVACVKYDWISGLVAIAAIVFFTIWIISITDPYVPTTKCCLT